MRRYEFDDNGKTIEVVDLSTEEEAVKPYQLCTTDDYTVSLTEEDTSFTPMFQAMVKVKKMHKDAIVPAQAEPGAAGYDLYAIETKTVNPGETVIFDTGIAFELPIGVFGAIYARSGLSIKQGLRPANCVGVADPSFRGGYMVALYNDSSEAREVSAGDRIAQVVFQPYCEANFKEVNELSETERGNGALGSTGK